MIVKFVCLSPQAELEFNSVKQGSNSIFKSALERTIINIKNMQIMCSEERLLKRRSVEAEAER